MPSVLLSIDQITDRDYLAGARFAVNCIQDHRTWFNLQVSYI